MVGIAVGTGLPLLSTKDELRAFTIANPYTIIDATVRTYTVVREIDELGHAGEPVAQLTDELADALNGAHEGAAPASVDNATSDAVDSSQALQKRWCTYSACTTSYECILRDCAYCRAVGLPRHQPFNQGRCIAFPD